MPSEKRHLLSHLAKRSTRLLFLESRTIYIVIPPNSNTFSDWRRTCRVSLVKTSWRPRANKTSWPLGQQQLELSTHTWSGRAPLKRRQNCTPADVKQIIFICVLFYFELGGITKHLMTGPSGNSEFCFPSTSMFPSASPRGTLRVSGKQNSLFPLGPVIKCLIISKSEWDLISCWYDG